MPELSDIYVLSEKRDKNSINSFLNFFLPQREESADEYEIPQYADKPKIRYQNDFELIEYCSTNWETEYSIYWRAIGGSKPEHAMVFFLNDGNVIYGLSTDACDKKYAASLLKKLKTFLGSPYGYIGHEASPEARNANDFKQQMESHKR